MSIATHKFANGRERGLVRKVGTLGVLVALAAAPVVRAANAPQSSAASESTIASPASATPISASPGPSISENLEPAITKPKHEPKLAFPKPGVVSKVNVLEGDRVKKGQVLAQQDDQEEQAELKKAQGEVEAAALQIDASIAQAELSKTTLARKLALYGDKPNLEVDEARANVKVGEATVKYHTQMREKAKLQLESVKVVIEQRLLRSPIDGFVAKIEIQVGEGTDIQRQAIQVVMNDTLKVDVQGAPVSQVKQLKVGQNLMIRYLDEDKWMTGKITFITPYANSSAGTRAFQMEMVNTEGREAGVNCLVKMPDSTASAK